MSCIINERKRKQNDYQNKRNKINFKKIIQVKYYLHINPQWILNFLKSDYFNNELYN